MGSAWAGAVGFTLIAMAMAACGSNSSGSGTGVPADAGPGADASTTNNDGSTSADAGAGCAGNGGGATFDNVDGGAPEKAIFGQTDLKQIDAKTVTLRVDAKDNAVHWQKLEITLTRPIVTGKKYTLTSNPTVAEGQAYVWYQHANEIDGADVQWEWSSSGGGGTISLDCANDDINHFDVKLVFDGVEMVPSGAQTTGRPVLRAKGTVSY